jgi:heme-degrading monooxygenase HmoA
MYARTNTVMADPQAIDEGIANVRDEVMPLVQGMDGFIGLSMLADRDSGRCIVTTAWTTEEAMHASEQGVRASREKAGRIFGGMPEVKEYEIAVMHRMHETGDGARARVIWGTTEPARMDDMLSSWRMTMLPKMEELPGSASCTILVDRATGRTAMTVTYDSADAMRQANDRAAQLRSEAPTTLGMTIDEVAEFDLVIAHLRVPETV